MMKVRKAGSILALVAAVVAVVAAVCGFVVIKDYSTAITGLSLVFAVVAFLVFMFGFKNKKAGLLASVLAGYVLMGVLADDIVDELNGSMTTYAVLGWVLLILLAVCLVFSLKNNAKWAGITSLGVVVYETITLIPAFTLSYKALSELIADGAGAKACWLGYGILAAAVSVFLLAAALIVLLAAGLLPEEEKKEELPEVKDETPAKEEAAEEPAKEEAAEEPAKEEAAEEPAKEETVEEPAEAPADEKAE